MDINYARQLLAKTREDYNLIAQDYTRTRAFIPEDIRELAEYSSAGERVLDSGCASGRLFEMFAGKGIDYYGVDISERLIDIAKENHPQTSFQVADALSLPFSSGFFDKVYSISVLHHIPSKDLQLQYLKEARRVLKPKGLLVLRVWDFWTRKRAFGLLLKQAFLKVIGGSKLDWKDVFVPWKDSKGRVLVQRYFHCFTKRELETLVKEAGLRIKKSWRKGQDPRSNIYVMAVNAG